MKDLEVSLPDARATWELGLAIGAAIERKAILALEGPLGAGKTLLVKGIAEALGVVEVINSPTFTMLNEYHSGRLPAYHLDLYRLTEEEGIVAALGGDDLALLRAELEEFIHADCLVVIEWAERLRPFLPVDHLLIRLDYAEQRPSKAGDRPRLRSGSQEDKAGAARSWQSSDEAQGAWNRRWSGATVGEERFAADGAPEMGRKAALSGGGATACRIVEKIAAMVICT